MKEILEKLKSNKEVVFLLDEKLKGLKGELLSELKEYSKLDENKIKLKQEIEKLKVKRGEIETLIAKGKEINKDAFILKREKVHDKDVVRLFYYQDPDKYEILIHNRETATDFAFIPGGNIVVNAFHDGKIGLFEWSLNNKRLIVEKKMDKKMLSLQVSPDGKILVSGGDDATITLWDLPQLEIKAELKEHNGGVTCLALTPQGEILISGEAHGSPYMSEIILWDLKRKRVIKRLKGHGGGIASLAISSDGKMLASGEALGNSEDPQPSKIILWDLDNFRIKDILEGHNGWIKSLIFTKDGKLLISGDALGSANNPKHSDIIIWDLRRGIPSAKLQGHNGWVRSLSLNNAETILASGGSNGTFISWDFSKVKKEFSLSGIIPK